MPGTPLGDLKQRIADGKALVIVGTGVSIAATADAPCASWKGLLRDGVERCVSFTGAGAEWASIAQHEIASDELTDVLHAAEKIATRLGGANGRGNMPTGSVLQ